MNRIRLIEWFSLALLVLAGVGSVGIFFIAHRHLPPLLMTFLFVGLIGSMVSHVLRNQQRHLEQLESEFSRLKGE